MWGWQKQAGLETDVEEKGGDCHLCSAFSSDLPCMHLDPGVNRLGLNVTSIHQTDRRPVTPDIVFPICVILWPWEEGLKKKQQNNKKKRSLHFTNTLKDQRSFVRLLPEVGDYEQAKGKRANQRGRKGFRWAEGLWETETAERPECSSTHTQWCLPYFKSNSVILQARWTCCLKGGNDSLVGF